MIVYSQFSRLRRREYQLATLIEGEGDGYIVKKRVLTPEAKAHLQGIVENHALLERRLASTAEVRLPKILSVTSDSVTFEFVEGTSLDKVLLRSFLAGDQNGFLASIDHFRSILMHLAGPRPQNVDPRFEAEATWLAVGILDPNFDNVIVSSDGTVSLIDNEWVSSEPIPVSLALHRALWVFYHYKYHEHALEQFIPWSQLIERYQIGPDLSVAFQQFEANFQQNVYGENKAHRDRYRKPVLHIPGQVGIFSSDESLQNILAIKDAERERSLRLVLDAAAQERERILRIKDEERTKTLRQVVEQAELERLRVVENSLSERTHEREQVLILAARDKELALAQMVHEHREAITQVARDKELALAQLVHEHREAIAQVARDKEQALAQMVHEHREAIAQVTRDKEQALAQMVQEHREAIAQVTRDKEQALAQMVQEHQESIAQVIRDKDLALAQARQGYEQALQQQAVESEETRRRILTEGEGLASRLRASVADLTARLDRVENSGFWKVTLPLRWIKALLTSYLRAGKRFFVRGLRYAGRRFRLPAWVPDPRLHWAVDSDLSTVELGSPLVVDGWCFHESLAVVQISVQCGTQMVRPDLYQLRSDLEVAYPGQKKALYSGFRATWYPTIAGQFRVKLKVELENHVFRTVRVVVKTRVVEKEISLATLNFDEAGDWLSQPVTLVPNSRTRVALPGVTEILVRDAESHGNLERLRLRAGSIGLTRLPASGSVEFLVSRQEVVARPEGQVLSTLERFDPPRSLPRDLLPLLKGKARPDRTGQRTESVTIIVCVHNAFDDVKRCLDSILRSTEFPYAVHLVDDGSAEDTKVLLETYASRHGWLLIRNPKAKGYTFAANQGLRSAKTGDVVLLNSDTVLPWGWLERLAACAASDPKIGIVSPLSNTASWQSVPKIFDDDGDWSENRLPSGVTVDEISHTVAQLSARPYPRLGFLNGFCLYIKRPVIEQSGYFDEANFGAGYGEENDYCIRAQNLGWDLAVADDAYVYHAQSKSYSSERRLVLAKNAGDRLVRLHGQATVDRLLAKTKNNLVMESVRAAVVNAPEKQRIRTEIRRRWEGRRVAFVLPTGGVGGGTNVVIDEARTLYRLGVDVRIVNLPEYREGFERDYPEPGVPVLYVKPADFGTSIKDMEYIIATANRSVEWLAPFRGEAQVRGYYIQDYEPDFYPPGSQDELQAVLSYSLFPDLRGFCKTQWNRKKLEAELAITVPAIGVSYSAELFRPQTSLTAKGLRDVVYLCAMVRPVTPRRNPEFTMAVLAEVSRRCGDRVKIHLFGCDNQDPGFVQLTRNFPFENLGILTNEAMALMMNEQDIFADLSTFQAMGLTALEAMSCGVAVVVPSNGGTTEFVAHRDSGLVVDTSSLEDCVASIVELVENPELRTSLQLSAIRATAALLPERAILAMMEALDA